MLSILLKKQMTEIFRGYFFDAKKNKARSKAATAAYIVLFFGIMVGLPGGMFTYLSLLMCGALAAVGMDRLYFALMRLPAVMPGVFGSVFNTYSSLYLSKDNDLLPDLESHINADTLIWNTDHYICYCISHKVYFRFYTIGLTKLYLDKTVCSLGNTD